MVKHGTREECPRNGIAEALAEGGYFLVGEGEKKEGIVFDEADALLLQCLGKAVFYVGKVPIAALNERLLFFYVPFEVVLLFLELLHALGDFVGHLRMREAAEHGVAEGQAVFDLGAEGLEIL
jgi:hypothetical protein